MSTAMLTSKKFKPCPDEEGIKTISVLQTVQRLWNSNLALMKKGLRRDDAVDVDQPVDSNLALMKKGLRPALQSAHSFLVNSNLALMKKGLRHKFRQAVEPLYLFKPCPDEEGIKTRPQTVHWIMNSGFKPCPDEEGIKTDNIARRRSPDSIFKPCPDEEGIKTTAIATIQLHGPIQTLP